MLQIAVVGLMLLVGALVLTRHEMKATSTRVIRGGTLRALGIVTLILAALPIVLDPLLGTVLAIGCFLLATIVTIAVTPAAPGDPEAAQQREGRREPKGPQLVGETCSVCRETIVVATEGCACPQCSDPVHVDCLRAHRKAAHAKRRALPRARPA